MISEQKADSRLTVILGSMLTVMEAEGRLPMIVDSLVDTHQDLIKAWLPGIVEALGIDEVRRQIRIVERRKVA